MMELRQLPTPHGAVGWRVAILWLGAAALVSTIATYLAYGPLSSDAWQCWSGPGAWKRDALRVVLASILAFVLLRNMGAIRNSSQGTVPKLMPQELAVLCVVVGILIIHEVTVSARSFMADLPDRHCPAYSGFRQIYFPYIPYTFYVLGLWIGVAFPVLIFLIRSLPADVRWSRANWNILRRAISREASTGPDLALNYRELVLGFEDYVLGLKDLAQRYIPVIFIVSLVLLYEQLTPSSRTTTGAALEAAKLGLWILLGPAFLLCLVLVVFRYQRASEATVRALGAVAAHAATDASLFDSVLEKRSELSWERGTLQFVLSIFQSATFTIAFIAAASSYALSSAVLGQRLLYILVPRAIIEFIKSLFI